MGSESLFELETCLDPESNPEGVSEFTEGAPSFTISLIYCDTALVLCSVHLKVEESVFL